MIFDIESGIIEPIVGGEALEHVSKDQNPAKMSLDYIVSPEDDEMKKNVRNSKKAPDNFSNFK